MEDIRKEIVALTYKQKDIVLDIDLIKKLEKESIRYSVLITKDLDYIIDGANRVRSHPDDFPYQLISISNEQAKRLRFSLEDAKKCEKDSKETKAILIKSLYENVTQAEIVEWSKEQGYRRLPEPEKVKAEYVAEKLKANSDYVRRVIKKSKTDLGRNKEEETYSSFTEKKRKKLLNKVLDGCSSSELVEIICNRIKHLRKYPNYERKEDFTLSEEDKDKLKEILKE